MAVTSYKPAATNTIVRKINTVGADPAKTDGTAYSAQENTDTQSSNNVYATANVSSNNYSAHNCLFRVNETVADITQLKFTMECQRVAPI